MKITFILSEINTWNFVETLTNDIVSFEQSGPEIKPYLFMRPRGYKTIFMLNSTEHEIFQAHSSILSLSEPEIAEILDIFILLSIWKFLNAYIYFITSGPGLRLFAFDPYLLLLACDPDIRCPPCIYIILI